MTRLFESLQISGYRGFEAIELSSLGQVNIFVGNNNSGKTSILEAVSILCNPLDPFQWLEVAQRRLYLGRMSLMRPDLEAIKWIFFRQHNLASNASYQGQISIKCTGNSPIKNLAANLTDIYGASNEKSSPEKLNYDSINSENDLVISGLELNVKAHILEQQGNILGMLGMDTDNEQVFQFWEKERFIQRRRPKKLVENATIFPAYSSSDPISDRFSTIILNNRENKKDEILDLIRSFDDSITDIQILSPNNKSTVYIEHKQLGFAPLYVFGDGFKRTLVMALSLLTITDGVLLIDEIETSIHISALSCVFSWLIKTCHQRKIQLFVTTHSLEAVDAMLQSEKVIEDVVAFRLNFPREKPQRFSGDLLHRLRWERGLDVR
jgi:AAA15 family ATPase/GTPase